MCIGKSSAPELGVSTAALLLSAAIDAVIDLGLVDN